MELKAGAGDDPDTLSKNYVWVYDTQNYPFHQAEIYHQFHDDYLPMGDYPICYEALTNALMETGRLSETSCPGEQGYRTIGTPAPCDWQPSSGEPKQPSGEEPKESSNSDEHSAGHKEGGSGGASEEPKQPSSDKEGG